MISTESINNYPAPSELEFEDYETVASATVLEKDPEKFLPYAMAKLFGESGEVIKLLVSKLNEGAYKDVISLAMTVSFLSEKMGKIARDKQGMPDAEDFRTMKKLLSQVQTSAAALEIEFGDCCSGRFRQANRFSPPKLCLDSVSKEEVQIELGDVLWYVVNMGRLILGPVSFKDILKTNWNKLSARYRTKVEEIKG